MHRETDKVKFTVTEDHIMHIECFPNTIMTIDEGRESTRIVGEMINQPLPMLCDLTNVIRMTQECRHHFAGNKHARVFTKCALIVESPLARIIGNFFLGANKPVRPTRLFTNTEKALAWLKE